MLHYTHVELMEGFRKGNNACLMEIFSRHAKPLNYFLYNMKVPWEEAEDIVAESFVKIFKRKDSIQSYDHLKASLYVIAKNGAFDWLTHKGHVIKANRELLYLGNEVEQQMDVELLKSALLGELIECMEKLPPRRRAILHKYFFEDKTTMEIAAEFNIANQTALNHKTRAIDALKQIIHIESIKDKYLSIL